MITENQKIESNQVARDFENELRFIASAEPTADEIEARIREVHREIVQLSGEIDSLESVEVETLSEAEIVTLYFRKNELKAAQRALASLEDDLDAYTVEDSRSSNVDPMGDTGEIYHRAQYGF